MEILEGQTLEMSNVLSYRAKMTQADLMQKSLEIEKVISDRQARHNGPTVTSTFSIESDTSDPVMDVEILVPLDRTILPPSGYVWKPTFRLTNALMIRHIGHPSGLQATANELNRYIIEHKLIPITGGYNVTIRDAKAPQELDQMEVNIYVGISPNEL